MINRLNNIIIYHWMTINPIIIFLITILSIVKGTILITSPLVTTFTDNKLLYDYANFGKIKYQKSLNYHLLVLDHQLCENLDQLKPLTQPTYIVIKSTTTYTCSYTRKAINAQNLGAKGIIFATLFEQPTKKVVQSDDGNGKKVHISALFIAKEDYHKLTELSKIQITANFPLPKQKVAKINLFLSSSKRSSYIFLRRLKQDYKALSEHIQIQPIYETISCASWCGKNNCYLQQYCAFNHEAYQLGVGQTIIKQQLHQHAIYKQRGVTKWLEYMNLFDEYCDDNWIDIDPCVRKIIAIMKMDDVALVNAADTLANWRLNQNTIGFDSVPEIAINNLIYRGNFEPDQIISTICESLISPPRHCQQLIIDSTHESHLSPVLTLSLLMIVNVIFLFGGCMIYRRCINRQITNDMSTRVSELVARYATKVSQQQKERKHKLIQELHEEL